MEQTQSDTIVDANELVARIKIFIRQEIAAEWSRDCFVNGSQEKSFWFALATVVSAGADLLVEACKADGKTPLYTFKTLQEALIAGVDATVLQEPSLEFIRMMTELNGKLIEELESKEEREGRPVIDGIQGYADLASDNAD